jgi:hypothetical protein
VHGRTEVDSDFDQLSEQPAKRSGWLTEEEARKLISGPLGDVYRDVLRKSIAPLYWHPKGKSLQLDALRHGTATLVRTPEKLFGITAAHVIHGLRASQQTLPQTIQLMNAELPQLNLIDINEDLDLATFEIEENLLGKMGKNFAPLTVWPPQLPQEKGGILLGGYPKISRVIKSGGVVEWGILAATGIVDQITPNSIIWTIEREHNVEHPAIPEIPANPNLGGISGGPVIALLHRNGLHYFGLAGIVVAQTCASEYVIARRADGIQADGSILPKAL